MPVLNPLSYRGSYDIDIPQYTVHSVASRSSSSVAVTHLTTNPGVVGSIPLPCGPLDETAFFRAVDKREYLMIIFLIFHRNHML